MDVSAGMGWGDGAVVCLLGTWHLTSRACNVFSALCFWVLYFLHDRNKTLGLVEKKNLQESARDSGQRQRARWPATVKACDLKEFQMVNYTPGGCVHPDTTGWLKTPIVWLVTEHLQARLGYIGYSFPVCFFQPLSGISIGVSRCIGFISFTWLYGVRDAPHWWCTTC